MSRTDLWNLGASLGVAFAVALLGAPARAQTITPPPVPGDLGVPAGNKPFLIANAEGTQNYVCLPSGSTLEWKLQAPQATGFVTVRWMNSEARQQIMTHFLSPNPMESGLARPTWQSSVDTSSVWAKKIQESSDPNYVAPGAIPWLLLQAVGKRKGPTGGSILAETTYIQRVHTAGGALAGGCVEAGSMMFVPYTADYVFYKAN